MSIRRVVPDINTNDMEESVKFYTGLFGFQVAMDMNWIVTLASPSNATAQINLLKNQSPSPQQPGLAMSIEVADVDAVHATAVALGAKIIYPLTDEPWGVRRFHVADPNNILINVMMHQKR
ncbi:MAG TPA: VOC family protein [Bacteroidota bacterium]|nr:VOC family protein [Bacteroidota bacterium]